MKNPLGSTNGLSSLFIGHLKPVAIRRGSMPGPLSRGALSDIKAFKDLPEAIERLTISFVLYNSHVGELFFRTDLGQLQTHFIKVVQDNDENKV